MPANGLQMSPMNALSEPSLMQFSQRRMLRPANAVSPSTPDPQVHSHEKEAANGLYSNAPTTFDSNIVIIMAGLLSVLICALSINSIVRCALRCTSRIVESPEEAAVRLANKGMKKKEVKSLPTAVYGKAQIVTQTGSVCPICFFDFADGERLKILPGCKHVFHVECIDPWLMAKSSCPTCRTSLMAEKRSKGVQIVMTQCRVIADHRLPTSGSPAGSPCRLAEAAVPVAGTDIAPRLIVSVTTSTHCSNGSTGADSHSRSPCAHNMLIPEATVVEAGTVTAPAGLAAGATRSADNMLSEVAVLEAVGSPLLDNMLPEAAVLGAGLTGSPSTISPLQ